MKEEAQKLQEASLEVRSDSMDINEVFSAIESDLDDLIEGKKARLIGLFKSNML